MKQFHIMYNVGCAKYMVSYHNGIKKHGDGSDFFDIEIFHNKKKLNVFVDDLRKQGYIEQ